MAHVCVIRDDDALLCWGRNGYGELGLGNTDSVGDDEVHLLLCYCLNQFLTFWYFSGSSCARSTCNSHWREVLSMYYVLLQRLKCHCGCIDSLHMCSTSAHTTLLLNST
jgi:Regulator of chromosome condensation (RCC1) repeat